MSDKKAILRWKKTPRETELARVYNRRDSYDLWYGDVQVASAGPEFEGWNTHGTPIGYYWCCASNEALGIQHRSIASTPLPTLEDAKQSAREYIEACLVQKGLRKG